MESAHTSFELQVWRVKLIPERRWREGILLEAWRCVEPAQPASGSTCSLILFVISTRQAASHRGSEKSVIMIRHA